MTRSEFAWNDPEPEVLTAKEAAEFLRMGINQLYEAANRREIPCRRIGRSLKFSRTALVRWLGESAK